MGLFEKLNDWIIFGLKKENDVINQSLKEIQNCVNNQIKYQVRDLKLKISDVIKPFSYLKD